MRVSLNHARIAEPKVPGLPDAILARPLLDPGGARVILGECDSPMGLAQPIVPARDTLFGPRGACLAAPGGPLLVCDTGHHRLLIWTHPPDRDHTPADFVIGQPDFSAEGRNAKGSVTAATLNVPTGVAATNSVLAVADAWNHRVLIWHGLPTRSNQPADVVLGQADFSGGLANRGTGTAQADTLNWCYGVTISQGRLLVADTGNRRVLLWNSIPTQSGAAADLVLGQKDFTTRDENGGDAPSPSSMRWPHGMVIGGAHCDPAKDGPRPLGQTSLPQQCDKKSGRLLIADAGNNRIMVWDRIPERNGAPCDFVLGQPNTARVEHNMAAYYPTAGALNMPYGLAAFGDMLAVADTANSRLIGFDIGSLSMGARATRLAGQSAFANKGDNRWGCAMRDSVCWPYSVAASGSTLIVADSGNNRVLLWEAAK